METLKSPAVLAQFWGLFCGPRPDASTVTRDTVVMFFFNLLVYRHERNATVIGHAVARGRQLSAAASIAAKLMVDGRRN